MRYNGKRINRLWNLKSSLSANWIHVPLTSGLMFPSIVFVVYQMKIKVSASRGCWHDLMNPEYEQGKCPMNGKQCQGCLPLPETSFGPSTHQCTLDLHLCASSMSWQQNVQNVPIAKNIFSWRPLTKQICLVFNTVQQSGLCSPLPFLNSALELVVLNLFLGTNTLFLSQKTSFMHKCIKFCISFIEFNDHLNISCTCPPQCL